MSRYIDADALVKVLERYDDYAIAIVNDQPTEDVVEVVRCKDCKHSVKHQLGYGCGMNYHLATNGEWFCADGERREDGEIHWPN